MTVTERLLRDAKYELPGTGVERLAVDEAFVADPAAAIRALLLAGHGRREQDLAARAHRFAAQFSQQHGLTIRFDDEAAHRLAADAETGDVPMRDLCERLFKDYQFGLKLVQKNTGQRDFLLTVAAVKNPDKFISELVVASYQGHPEAVPRRRTMRLDGSDRRRSSISLSSCSPLFFLPPCPARSSSPCSSAPSSACCWPWCTRSG